MVYFQEMHIMEVLLMVFLKYMYLSGNGILCSVYCCAVHLPTLLVRWDCGVKTFGHVRHNHFAISYCYQLFMA